ncbi:MAG: tyrosine-type recombinase/integrase [Sulfuritalea sp.]|nr:tyrosine-type recombinase/integrase [Sulfuritalea sp.]
MKEVFLRTAERIRLRGPDSERVAALLEDASAHWLRHTAGTSMASANMDLMHVRGNLGYESISTTSHYLHPEDDEHHKETERKHRLQW